MSTSRRDFLKNTLLSGAAIGMSSMPVFGKEIIEFSEKQVKARKGKSMLGFAAAPLKTVRIGFIGLGMRGPDAVRRMMKIEGVEVKALCDLLPERVKKVNAAVVKEGRPEAAEYSGEEGWKKLCERDDIDLVYTCTPWLLHTPICLYAMKHGKHAVTEVPAALTIKDCWELVNT